MITSYPVYQWLVMVGGLLMAGCSSPGHPRAYPEPALLAFEENGRWGYLDSTGAVVLQPRYRAAGSFSEGMAPVRIGGLYGYINRQGQYVLPPVYAYATQFRAGRAVVWPDSTPQLIDHDGHQVPLNATYQQLEWQPGLDHSGIWVGTLATGKRHVLAANGQQLSQAVFKRVGALSNNRVVVEGVEPLRNAEGNILTEAVAVLDARGRLVIPYYRFSSISTFCNGLATASLYQPGDAPEPQCIIDTTGRILARLPHNMEFADYSEAEFADGVVRVHISKNGDEANLDNSYPAVVDQRGRVLFHNRRLQRLTDFYHGRAWAQEKDGDWYLIDKTGRRLSAVAVQRPLRPGGYDAAPAFANGAEVVLLGNDTGYAAFDSTGRVLRQLADSFPANPGDQAGALLPLYAADSTEQLGFWNWRTGQLVPPRFTNLDNRGYVHGLLAVVEGARSGYLTPTGTYAWQQPAATSTPLNLDFKRRAFYPVASPPLAKFAGFGGWGHSGNGPRSVRPAQHIPPATVSLRVEPQPVAKAFAEHFDGHMLYLANTTTDTVVFDAQDSSLFLTLQAQDAQGKWHDIEYNPSSFCGNSYHQVFLAPGQCWQLVVPAYAGGQPTQLRARLQAPQSRGKRPKSDLLSNPFPGSVNPAQFWRTEGHSRQGIMDPYLN